MEILAMQAMVASEWASGRDMIDFMTCETVCHLVESELSIFISESFWMSQTLWSGEQNINFKFFIENNYLLDTVLDILTTLKAV